MGELKYRFVVPVENADMRFVSDANVWPAMHSRIKDYSA